MQAALLFLHTCYLIRGPGTLKKLRSVISICVNSRFRLLCALAPTSLVVPSDISGKVSISTNNVQNLMMASSYLQLSRVRDACAEFLMARLSPANVVEVTHFASLNS